MSGKKRKKKTRTAERIALCMIVKDEEANLERCLKSVRGLVSEINIVDTGSADDTVRIAKRLGADIREEHWNDDFSHARNISLGMARADWILALDADEVLSPEAIPKIKSAIRNRNITAYLLPTRNYMNDSTVANFVPNDWNFESARHCRGWVESRKVRLFRRLPGIRFEGEIHEVVGPSVRRLGKRIEFLDAVVHHFGHMAPEDSLRDKAERMARMAESKCAGRPDDYKAHYELGVILAQLGRLEKAEDSFRKSIALRDDFALAHYDLGVVLSRAGREKEAVEEYRAAAQIDPNAADAMNNLADSLQKLRRDEEAEQAYRKLLDKHPMYKRGWNNLGALLASKGRLAEAEEAFRDALRIDPQFSDARQNLQKLQGLKPRESGLESREPRAPRLRPGISLCMIVRNEEENLPGALKQIGNAVDELVVADTGSADNTRSLAESAGARIFDYRWANDFAAARNFAISKASHEWILVLDADETIGVDDLAALRSLTQNTGALGFSFETRNYSRDSSLEGWRPVSPNDKMACAFPGWFPSEKVRLFRNAPEIRFEGAIHELVEASILRAGGAIERADIPIHHYGYDRAPEKAQAYLEPATRKALDDPESAQAQYELGAVLHRLGRFEEACEVLGKATGLAPEQTEYLVALGDSLRAAEKTGKAETAYRKALRLQPGLSSAHRGLGIVLFSQGKVAASREEFEEALRLCPHDAQSLTNLGVIASRAGNTDEAAERFRRALEINPHNATAKNNLRILSVPAAGSPSLGLLMIVRDERDNLRELLPALAPCFDEIVIVDTGSVDDTVAFSKKFTDKVFTFPWIDDFSAARNFGLAKMQAPWVLWLDADDRMKPEDAAMLRRHISEDKKAFLLRVVSGIDGSGTGEFLQLRLFPNIEGIKWEGRIHEQLLPSIERIGLGVETLSNIAITHMGYDSPEDLRKKSKRNASLLEKERASRPDDPHVLQHLAQAYGLLGEIDKAVEASEALVNSRNPQTPDEFLAHSMNRLIQYSLILNDIDKARLWADRALEVYPQDRLARYFLGEIRYRENLPNEAIEWFEQFVDGKDVIGCVPVPWETLTASAHNFLGVLYEQIGKRDKARAAFRRAIEEGARVEAHKNLARLLLEDGGPAEAESVLRAAAKLQGDDAVVWINLGAALARSGKLREAAEASRKALEIEPDNTAARQNLRRIEGKLTTRKSAPAKAYTLSACIIAKNEAKCLGDAIDSIASICDEIIVVDTGSTDSTVEIARSRGAIVQTFEWNDDFAVARNYSLGLASCEWILVIDADEIIDARDLQKLTAFRPGDDVWGCSMTTRNYSPDREVIGWRPVEPSEDLARGMPGWLPSTKIRLFRNMPDIRFEGRVHECVEPSILRAGGRIESLDVPVHHYGCIKRDDAKRRRYLEMAEMKADENSDDPRAHFELGVQRMVAGNIAAAEQALSRTVDLDPSNELALLNLAGAKIKLDRFAEARDILEKTINANPNSACAHYNLGVALEKLESFDKAEEEYAKALALDPNDSNALAKLGYLEARKNNLAAARNYLERALELDPANSHARNNLEYVRLGAQSHPVNGCDLSLNMIVRDEEENLKEGLSPIAGLFDEIVVVDTGSSDNTVRTAEALGARIIRHPWNDSFSDARNAALRASTGKWIFWLDADDRIEPGAVRTLRNFVKRGIPCGAFFPLESVIGDNGSTVQNYSLRLFPNSPEIKWTGAVHEQVAGALRDADIELVNCPDFAIRHIGYEQEGVSLKKNLRNLKLLAKELAEKPEDPYILFALAQAFLFCGQAGHARKWLGALWDLREKTGGAASGEIFWMAAMTLSDCALKTGDMAEANAWLERAIEDFPDNWVAYFQLGERKLAEGDLERASALLCRTADIGIAPTLLPLDIDDMRGKLDRYLSQFKRADTVAHAETHRAS